MSELYDVVIIGGGPAGLAAGLYAGRAKLSCLIIEKEQTGGQIVLTSEIENYPGSLESESGASLMERFRAQAERFGAEFTEGRVTGADFSGPVKKVFCADAEYDARAVIIASGARPAPIGCKGEAELTGAGVSYCATCDAFFFEGLDVYVVGGGDSAVEEALYLTKFARHVTLIHRRDSLRAAKTIQEKAFANEKLSIIWDTVVEELGGEYRLESIKLKNVKTGETRVVESKDEPIGLFVFIGYLPETECFAESGIEMENGYIKTDAEMRTAVPGVYAAGDCRVKELRQVVTAASDGATAAFQVSKYLG